MKRVQNCCCSLWVPWEKFQNSLCRWWHTCYNIGNDPTILLRMVAHLYTWEMVQRSYSGLLPLLLHTSHTTLVRGEVIHHFF